ncbi:MAG: hypothetical protein QOJ49_1695 [Actinomycetota bacterium]|nr:hypothetical protein [Actinomycetota bacterium]
MHGRTGTDWPRWAAIAAVAVGLATGCSDPDPPGTLPKTSPVPVSSTASPSATPTTPEQQVEATMRAYVVAANRMFTTGQVDELRTFSISSCPCRKITNSVERVVAGGGRYEGARYDLKTVNVHDVVGLTAGAEVNASVPPYRVLDGAGAVKEDSPGGSLHDDFSLVKQGNRWIITNAVNLNQ